MGDEEKTYGYLELDKDNTSNQPKIAFESNPMYSFYGLWCDCMQSPEDANNYVGNSDILKRKSSTPFHESTHFLFNNSQIKKDIENEKSPEIKGVLNQVISKFEKKEMAQHLEMI